MIFRYTILYVGNVKESMDFFNKASGIKKQFLHESGDYGELETGETKLAFSSTELMKQLGKNPSAPTPSSPTFEIALESDDVKTDLARAIDAGATLIQDARDEPCGQTTSYVSDPNGYLIKICSKVPICDPHDRLRTRIFSQQDISATIWHDYDIRMSGCGVIAVCKNHKSQLFSGCQLFF